MQLSGSAAPVFIASTGLRAADGQQQSLTCRIQRAGIFRPDDLILDLYLCFSRFGLLLIQRAAYLVRLALGRLRVTGAGFFFIRRRFRCGIQRAIFRVRAVRHAAGAGLFFHCWCFRCGVLRAGFCMNAGLCAAGAGRLLRRGRRRFFFSKRMAVKRSGLIFGDSQRAGKRHADDQCDADDQC